MAETIQGCTKEFWCIEMDCKSYHTGDGCDTCEKYGKCTNCVLQGTNPDDCADEAYHLTHGYPEEEER